MIKPSHPKILQIIDGDERFWLIRHEADGHEDHVAFRTLISERAPHQRAIFTQIVDHDGAKALCMRFGSDLPVSEPTPYHFEALFAKFAR
jgi:hypothetical protein